MAKRKSWKGLIAWLTLIALLIGAVDIVKNWASRSKPQILDVQNCSISIFPRDPFAKGGVWFELLVNNPNSKDCSIISIDLTGLNWPVDLEHRLPETIPAGHTKRIIIAGDFINKLELPPDQNSVEGTVSVKFNTNDISKKRVVFTVRRS